MRPSIFLFQLLVTAAAAALTPCQTQCGNISIPYPFGIGQPHCFRPGFNLTCNQTSTSRPKLYIGDGTYEATAISLTQSQAIVKSRVQTFYCNPKDNSQNSMTLFLSELGNNGPYTFSGTRNIFITIGCSVISYVTSTTTNSLCAAICSTFSEVQRSNGSCLGIGCCQITIGANETWLNMRIVSVLNLTLAGDIGPCTKAFLVDREWFRFNPVQLADDDFFSGGFEVPVVLDWAIPWETLEMSSWSCAFAAKNLTTYACLSKNSVYVERGIGYLCICLNGFEGNPYISNGCQDINECKLDRNPCLTASCLNTIGSYSCYCPKGTHSMLDGDPLSGCSPDIQIGSIVGIGGGAGLGILLILVTIFMIYKRFQEMKIKKHKEKCFHRNHGLLLQKLIASIEDDVERTKIFTLEELEKATNNFDVSRIVGQGGHGTVYKGILSDQRVVAVKKSETVDQSEIEQFINEVSILSQINHRNVVKLFGCCLEAEVPLLVYEFISGGTLSDHLHGVGNHISSLSFEDRLRIATEVAGALSYLHSAASISIFHRDIKSSNILLDHNYTAKLSDFGASRSISSDMTRVITMVQGTFGYMDPEYYHTGQLTEKSDVYSFGVILVELLTGRKAISNVLLKQDKNLAMHFVWSLKQNRLSQILDVLVAEEGRMEELEAIAMLAEMCLRLKGEERPTMKTVEQRLNGLSRMKKKYEGTSHQQKCEESDSFMDSIVCGSGTYDSTRSFSLEKEFIMCLKYHDDLCK